MKVAVYIVHDFDLWTIPSSRVEQIRREFPAHQVLHFEDERSFEQEATDAEVLYTWRIHSESFRRTRSLRWIHSSAAGVRGLLFPELVASDVLLTCSKGVHAVPIAEHAMALLLALSRKIHRAVELQRQGRWGQTELMQEAPLPLELAGLRLGVVGLGSIGAELARRAKAFDMEVWGLKREPAAKPAFVDRLLEPGGLGELLDQSDFVVLALPHTAATRGLMGQPELRRMKPTSFLINVGRGSVLDEEALARALREGWIAGAALDVFSREPLPRESPLYHLPNVIVSPHLAGVGPNYWERTNRFFMENLTRYLEGRPLGGLVDKERGY